MHAYVASAAKEIAQFCAISTVFLSPKPCICPVLMNAGVASHPFESIRRAADRELPELLFVKTLKAVRLL
jgi:hypothetical protein